MTDSSRSISVRTIDVITIEGKGVLSGFLGKHTIQFFLHRQLSRVVVTLNQSALGGVAFQEETFALIGTLADGRPIAIQELRVIAAQERGLVELRPWNCAVEIGLQCNYHPVASTFILTGSYEGDLELIDGEWGIALSSDSEAKASLKASQGLNIPLEGSRLNISARGKTRDEHERYAFNIMLLLSLACGTGITCHRWIFEYPGHEHLELWRSRGGEERGPGPIIEPSNLRHYLKTTLPTWHGLTNDEKKALRIAIIHLNNSGTGYIDTRLFQTAQIWEFLAKKWTPKEDLTEFLSELREKLKDTCKMWRKSHRTADPHPDPNGLITGRVLIAFDWPILRRQIEELAAREGLSLSLLGLDIDHLKSARDSVAHSITLEGVDPSSGPHYELLIRSQYALQLLLLLRLRYSGLVVHHVNGWLCAKDIGKFLLN